MMQSDPASGFEYGPWWQQPMRRSTSKSPMQQAMEMSAGPTMPVQTPEFGPGFTNPGIPPIERPGPEQPLLVPRFEDAGIGQRPGAPRQPGMLDKFGGAMSTIADRGLLGFAMQSPWLKGLLR